MKKIILPISILVLALAVTLSGCSLFGAAQVSGGASNHSDLLRLDAQQLSYPAAPTTQSQILTREEALALVQAEFPGHEIVLQEAELDDGVYEFDFTVDGVAYDYDVNAYTGEIVKRKIDRDDRVKSAPTATEAVATETAPTDPTAPATEAAPATLTLEAAKAIVLEHLGHPGAEFLKAEQDGGKYEFKVRFNGAIYDYEVSIRTGRILEAELEKAAVQAPAPTTPTEGTQLTMDEAKAIVLTHLGNTSAEFLSAELDDGKYEFDVCSNGVKYEYDISIRTGEILKVEVDNDRSVQSPAATTYISMDEAKAIVLNHLGDANAVFIENELDDDGAYEFEVRSNGVEYDYEVDAVTGTVLKAERDD